MSETEITAVFKLKSAPEKTKLSRTVQCRTVSDRAQSCYDQARQNTYNYYNTVEPVSVEALLTFLSNQGMEKSFLAYLAERDLNLSTFSNQDAEMKFMLSLDYLLKNNQSKYNFRLLSKNNVFLQISHIEEDDTKPIPLVFLKVKFQELKFWLDIQNIISQDKEKEEYLFQAEIITHNDVERTKSYLVFGKYYHKKNQGELEIIFS